MNPILIVDDNEQIVEILSRYSAAEGWPLLCARSGEEALSLFDAADPSVILLDILLPGIDGLEVCRRIRRVSGVPILMITAALTRYYSHNWKTVVQQWAEENGYSFNRITPIPK